MSQVLKCNACNIVIDELLAYVQNKISVIDEETLKRICVSAFTSSEISKSKSLLFESLPTDQRKIIRKRKGKEERDLDDIVSVFKSTDPDEIPVFVARVLEKLPPILFDHLDCTKLLKDITKLNYEIENIKNTYVTVQQLEDLRGDIHDLKHASLPPPISPMGYINMKRGAWNLESGPVGMTMSPTFDDHLKHSHNSCSAAQMISSDNTTGARVIPLSPTASPSSHASRGGQEPKDIITVPDMTTHVLPESSESSTLRINDQENTNPWQTVNRQKRRTKYRYMGESGKAEATTSSFKAAARKIPIFITNVHNETLESDIVDYIKIKTQERVFLEKINTKKVLDHKAYKFFVSESKVSMFLNEKLWPEGIIFRRFVHYKNRRAGGEAAAIGPLNAKHE